MAHRAPAVHQRLVSRRCAGAGVGLIDDPAAVAARAAQIGRHYEPEERNHTFYRELFEVYQKLYLNLKDQFAAMAMIGHPV